MSTVVLRLIAELPVNVRRPRHMQSSGPATVLWPSMFVDGRTFDPLLPLLPGRRLIVVDGPGLGASEPLGRRSTIAEAADAAQDLLT